jgi:hypothetical protein
MDMTINLLKIAWAGNQLIHPLINEHSKNDV